MPDVLVYNDNESAAKLLLRFLKNEGYQVSLATSAEMVLAKLREGLPHLLLLDASGDPGQTLEFAQTVHQKYPEMPLLAGVPLGTSVPGQPGLNGPKLDPAGISFVPRPFNIKHLLSAVQDILEFREELERGGVTQASPVGVGATVAVSGLSDLVAQSDAMQKLLVLLERIAPTEIAVFIHGEKGTEKEEVARALHQRSRRRDKPFVVFRCGDFPSGDVAVALFGGEEAGSGTRSGVAAAPFDVARSGTLFVDDLSLLPPAGQQRLAEALAGAGAKNSRTPAGKPRLVTAADAAPDGLTAKGFDPGLVRALTGVTLEIPPLRERAEDILPLAILALKREAGAAADLSALDAKVTAMLTRYNWPGNTAELEKFVIQAWRKVTAGK
jgi:DNA-binding NtrC family response regulator